MKKEYENPTIEVIVFESEDLMTESSNVTLGEDIFKVTPTGPWDY